jgi:hypothetical protein
MNWVSALAGVLVLWAGTAWGATLTWKANSEPDLAGYRVYQCSLQPCTPESGNDSLLVTLGKGTSFNIGTPAVTRYYFITAYDFANSESNGSNVVTFTPGGSPPPPPALVAPITFGATSSSATGNKTNRISWSHTVGIGTNRFLTVCTQARDTVAGDVAVTTVTANGVPLRKVRGDLRTAGAASFGTELWYLVNPGVGTNTIAVTWIGALSDYGVGSATSYFGVNQVTPIDAHAGRGGSGTTLSTAITTVTNHALITDCALGQANGGLTIRAGQTTRVDRLTTGTVDGIGVSTVNDKAVAGSETMDWTQAQAENWVISAVSLRPAL